VKILQINTEKTWRGGERQTCYILRGLREAAVEPALLCLAGHPLAQRAKALDIPVHEVSGQGEAVKFLATRGKDYDLLHAQTAKGQTVAVLTKPFHGKPVVYTRRVDFVPRGLLTRLKYRLTDRVVAISTTIRDILAGLGVENVAVIASAVEEKTLDVERGERLKEELGVRDRKIIATTAALVPHKDPLTMVNAVRELSRLRKDFVFLHFGQGALQEEVNQKIVEYHIGEFYRMLGHREDVEDFFSTFDVFVMSSEQEGLGSSVLDAFVYKVPVVSTDAGGMAECVGGNGLVCPVKDYHCLAKSIDRVLEDVQLRAGLVGKAYAHVLEAHSVGKMVSSYVNLYNAVLLG
jgi:glycosyltransferase involved in cell wall biosynthesis